MAGRVCRWLMPLMALWPRLPPGGYASRGDRPGRALINKGYCVGVALW
jgi:hypothetical protein